MRNLVIGIAIGIILMIVGVAASVALFAGYRAVVRPTVHNVTYRIGGTAGEAVVTFNREDTTVSVPWQTFEHKPTGSELFISARSTMDHGALTCEIIVDGKVLATSLQSGGSNDVACDTHVP